MCLRCDKIRKRKVASFENARKLVKLLNHKIFAEIKKSLYINTHEGFQKFFLRIWVGQGILGEILTQNLFWNFLLQNFFRGGEIRNKTVRKNFRASQWKFRFNQYFIKYSRFHENGSSSVHSFNDYYLSIHHYTGSWRNRFQETRGISMLCIFFLYILIWQ